MPAGHDRAALALRAASGRCRRRPISCRTMRPPPASVASAPRMKPPLQKSGMWPHQASSGVMPRHSAMRRAEAASAACACSTAFACAVVPEVKKIVAQSVGDTVRFERVEEARRRRRPRRSSHARQAGAAAVEQHDAAQRRRAASSAATPAPTSRSSGTISCRLREVVVLEEARQRDQQSRRRRASGRRRSRRASTASRRAPARRRCAARRRRSAASRVRFGQSKPTRVPLVTPAPTSLLRRGAAGGAQLGARSCAR